MITLKSKKEKNNILVLKKKTRETGDVLTLKFSPIKGPLFSFRPGQFVLVSFLDNRLGKQCRTYSISSCPQDKFLTLTVKKSGVFSSALHKLKIGEKVKIGSPQGDFYPEKSMKNLVFLAAGVGIAPFYSIINTYFRQGINNKNLTLFYSNKIDKNIVFFKELNKLAKKWRKFKIIYILTQQKKDCNDENKEFQRLDVKILKKYLKDLNNKHYFICGPIEFVNDLWQALRKNGVGENFIKTEAFC